MHKSISSLMLLASLASCIDKPHSTAVPSKKLIVTVVDYSKSYHSLITLDSQSVQSLFTCVAATGGTIAHIGIQDNSNLPIYLTRVEKIDTTNTATDNIYEQARANTRNSKILATYTLRSQQQVSTFLTETRRFKTSSYTDLQHALDITHSTVCEPIYTADNNYKRFVLVLSDMVQDVPHQKGKLLTPVDMCGATVLIIRPSNAFSQDKLQEVFNGSDVHIFSNLTDAISFINQQ